MTFDNQNRHAMPTVEQLSAALSAEANLEQSQPATVEQGAP